MNISEWLKHARDRLEETGCPDPDIDARWIAEDALGMTRQALFFESDRAIPMPQLIRLESMLRQQHELLHDTARRTGRALVVRKRWHGHEDAVQTAHLEKEIDELRRAIARQDILLANTVMLCDSRLEVMRVRVRVIHDIDEMLLECLPHLRHESHRIDICGKIEPCTCRRWLIDISSMFILLHKAVDIFHLHTAARSDTSFS